MCCGFISQAQKNHPLFTELPSKQTGIQFLNNIIEDDSLNVLRYEYLYNGAGVGIGDFNNDGLEDVFFSGNTAANKLFLNKGGFVFEDITKDAGVKGNGTWSTGVSIADVNGDGKLDIYVCHSGKYNDPKQLSNELFINTTQAGEKLAFKDSAAAYGLDAPGTQSTQAAFFDYDKDGDLDMFLLNHSNHSINPFLNTKKIRSTPNMQFGNRLFRNDRDAKESMVFTDVTLQAGIINHALNFGLSVTISDVNNDGWPDIYTTSDYTEKDCFYINNTKGGFTESLEHSMAHISKYSMGADIADYNNDGRPDIFTLDMLPEDNHRQKLLKGPDEYDQYNLLKDSGYYNQQMRNMLQLNQGTDANGYLRFSEIGQLADVSHTDWSWSGLFVDFDNDGWKDLMVTNGYLRDYTDLDFLKFTVADAKKKALLEGHQNFQTADLVSKMPANKLNNYIFKNNHDLTFSDRSKDWGFIRPTVSNAAAYADFDNDGDMDLVICNNNEPAIIYRNNQQETQHTDYVKLVLKARGLNTDAYGAKVTVTTNDGNKQFQELYPVRGYQSTVTQQLLFNIPAATSLKEIIVTWPDGIITKPTINTLNQLTVLRQEETTPVPFAALKPKEPLCKDITTSTGLDFVHHENDFVDFKDEILLPYMLSRRGPALAKADVNKDGLDDVYFGGAIGQKSVLYIQQKDRTFKRSESQPWEAQVDFEDVNALFFDADNDGDQDLYVVSGGNEYGDGSLEYQDRLYVNSGKGNFEYSSNALPAMLSSKQSVTADDFDNDGDADLFVGGACIPGSFPFAARSYLLKNNSTNGEIKFEDVTASSAPSLANVGIVTTTDFMDLNNDKYPELVIAGEWMPVQIWENNKGKFSENWLENNAMNGLWCASAIADVDGDGDMDILLGNAGLNNQFKASPKTPMTITAADFDDNGTMDAVFSYFIQGKSYQAASRDELLEQIVPLRKKFVFYKDYANAALVDIFPKDKLAAAEKYYCTELSSGVLWNDGNGKFSFKAFPIEAQFSQINGFALQDFDNDAKQDIFITGNFESNRVQFGQNDASLGLLMKPNSNQTFTVVKPYESGIYTGGDIRKLCTLNSAGGNTLLVMARNNDAPQVLQLIKK